MKQYATVMCTVSVNDTHGMEILAMWDGTRKFDDSSTPAGKKHDIMFIPLKDYNVNSMRLASFESGYNEIAHRCYSATYVSENIATNCPKINPDYSRRLGWFDWSHD